jgi:uncharacterized damage-inducible protein DinB
MIKSKSDRNSSIEHIHSFFKETYSRLDNAIENIDNKELNWRPSKSSNSIGNLLAHISGAEGFWIHHIVGGMKTDRVRQSEFEIKDFNIDELRSRIDIVHSKSLEILSRLSDHDLISERSFWSNIEQKEKLTTVHWCILHIIEHAGLHTGQIYYIRKMYADIKP